MLVISHSALCNEVNTPITRNSTFPGLKVTALHSLMESSPVTESLIITYFQDRRHSQQNVSLRSWLSVLPQLTIKSNSHFLMDLLQKNILMWLSDFSLQLCRLSEIKLKYKDGLDDAVHIIKSLNWPMKVSMPSRSLLTYIGHFYALYKAAKLKYLFERQANKKQLA